MIKPYYLLKGMISMNKNKVVASIESVLFYWADPMDVESLAKLFELKEKDVEELLNYMEEKYSQDSSGIELKKINKSYQLVTKKDYSPYIEKLTTKHTSKSLSSPLMEILSIIAYKQPLTRIEVDNIRGINSSSGIASLLERNLIKELGRLDQIGKPIIYGTTEEFLRVFGLKSIKDLPYDK